MGHTILKPWQHKILAWAASADGLEGWYLSGGTALAAFYLRHRISDDLDFFSSDTDPIKIHTYAHDIKLLLKADGVRFSKIHDRYQFFFTINGAEAKIEFTRFPFPYLKSPKKMGGIMIDSFHDIAANKLAALLDRFDPKDFVDLYFILQRLPLRTLRANVEKKFGVEINPLTLGSEFAKVRRIEALPRMKKKLAISALKAFFSKEAAKLKPEILA